MAHAAPTVSSTKETTNYARLCRLLVDAGTQALRDTFNAIHPPANLQSVLATNKATVQSLRKRKVINATQWGKLYPVIPSSVSSRDFDITLLMVLLRNLCGLPSPAAGWDTLPAATDVSLEADIARVKYYRNSVYGHAECASVDDATFNTCWGDIRDTLVRLGGAKYKAAIDDLETECMDPEVEDHYKELLSQWKKDEGNVKDKLDEVIEKLVELKTSSMTQKEKPEIEGQHLLMLFFCFFDFVCLRGFSSFFVLSRICTDNLSINTAIKEENYPGGKILRTKSGLFKVCEPAFESQSLRIVSATVQALRRVSVNRVVRKSMMLSYVVVDTTSYRHSFVFSQSCCEVSVSLSDVGGVAV